MPRRKTYQIAENGPIEDDSVSRSRRKRDCNALQDLGASLLKLAPSQLCGLPIPPAVLDAVMAAKSMRDERAKRRQIQYIGRLMREEVDVRMLKDALDA